LKSSNENSDLIHLRKLETGIDLLDFPTIIWMAIDYSVYTVLQASRRSWRIGQTRPVKVYYFAYEDTIQDDALQLVAAKVAASLRVNGDTVGDDSLADLDELASGDPLATLARIVTGETQIEARSLQQAFAEANAGIRQANTIIGEYKPADEEEPEPVVQSNDVERWPQPIPAGNGVSTNGVVPQQALFSRKQSAPPTNESALAAHPEEEQLSPHPPVPRPRLQLNQLSK